MTERLTDEDLFLLKNFLERNICCDTVFTSLVKLVLEEYFAYKAIGTAEKCVKAIKMLKSLGCYSCCGCECEPKLGQIVTDCKN